MPTLLFILLVAAIGIGSFIINALAKRLWKLHRARPLT
jgi:hypothetical protein